MPPAYDVRRNAAVQEAGKLFLTTEYHTRTPSLIQVMYQTSIYFMANLNTVLYAALLFSSDKRTRHVRASESIMK
jgi:hypothetical protein